MSDDVSSTEWFEGFFEGVFLDVWRTCVSPEQTALEVDFLIRELSLRPGARVVDIGCGLGRHTLELAGRGYAMTALEQSLEALDEARGLAGEQGLAVAWQHADMRDLEGDGEFDGAFALGNSFGYLDCEGTRAYLAAVGRALRPGARFAFDYGFAAESILPRLQGQEWAQIGDMLFLEDNRYLTTESCVETTYTVVRNGETHTKVGRQWVFTLRQIQDLLAEAGLRTLRLEGGLDGEPIEVGSPYLAVVAEREPP